jgi:hypothetical protein
MGIKRKKSGTGDESQGQTVQAVGNYGGQTKNRAFALVLRCG